VGGTRDSWQERWVQRDGWNLICFDLYEQSIKACTCWFFIAGTEKRRKMMGGSVGEGLIKISETFEEKVIHNFC
jgi:hypothetical protein